MSQITFVRLCLSVSLYWYIDEKGFRFSFTSIPNITLDRMTQHNNAHYCCEQPWGSKHQKRQDFYMAENLG